MPKKKFRIEDIFNNNPDVYNQYKFYPADIISDDEDGCPIITIGSGNAGKTFGELKEAIDHFVESRETGYFYEQVGFLFTTQKEVENQARSKGLFNKLLEEESTAAIYGDFISRLVFAKDWIYWKDDHNEWVPFARMYAISMHGTYKPEDHSKIGRMYMDEFMKEKYTPGEAWNIQDILFTVKRRKKPEDFKARFTSNSLSIASPLLMSWNVWELDDDVVTVFYSEPDKNGKTIPILKIINWTTPWEQIEEDFEDDPLLHLGSISGYTDTRLKNIMKYDNYNNLYPNLLEEHPEVLEYKDTIKCDELYIDRYTIAKDLNDQGQVLHYFAVNKDRSREDLSYAINRDDVAQGTPYEETIAKEMSRVYQEPKRFLFDSVASAKGLFNAVKKYFGY